MCSGWPASEIDGLGKSNCWQGGGGERGRNERKGLSEVEVGKKVIVCLFVFVGIWAQKYRSCVKKAKCLLAKNQKIKPPPKKRGR